MTNFLYFLHWRWGQATKLMKKKIQLVFDYNLYLSNKESFVGSYKQKQILTVKDDILWITWFILASFSLYVLCTTSQANRFFSVDIFFPSHSISIVVIYLLILWLSYKAHRRLLTRYPTFDIENVFSFLPSLSFSTSPRFNFEQSDSIPLLTFWLVGLCCPSSIVSQLDSIQLQQIVTQWELNKKESKQCATGEFVSTNCSH